MFRLKCGATEKSFQRCDFGPYPLRQHESDCNPYFLNSESNPMYHDLSWKEIMNTALATSKTVLKERRENVSFQNPQTEKQEKKSVSQRKSDPPPRTSQGPKAIPLPVTTIRKKQEDETPEQYRERWGLPSTYPMVAPRYAEQRRELAKKIGLGTSHRRQSAV